MLIHKLDVEKINKTSQLSFGDLTKLRININPVNLKTTLEKEMIFIFSIPWKYHIGANPCEIAPTKTNKSKKGSFLNIGMQNIANRDISRQIGINIIFDSKMQDK